MGLCPHTPTGRKGWNPRLPTQHPTPRSTAAPSLWGPHGSRAKPKETSRDRGPLSLETQGSGVQVNTTVKTSVISNQSGECGGGLEPAGAAETQHTDGHTAEAAAGVERARRGRPWVGVEQGAARFKPAEERTS